MQLCLFATGNMTDYQLVVLLNKCMIAVKLLPCNIYVANCFKSMRFETIGNNWYVLNMDSNRLAVFTDLSQLITVLSQIARNCKLITE